MTVWPVCKTWVQLHNVAPGQEGSPDCSARKFDFIVRPSRVAHYLRTVNNQDVAHEVTLTERIPSAPTTRSAITDVPSLNCSSTPSLPLSTMCTSFFDS